MSFKVGDVVRLKSGGTKMTVVEVKDEECIVCEWMSNTVHEQRKFPALALAICNDSGSSNSFGAPIILGD